MPTKKSAIYRTDLLPHRMNQGKTEKVLKLIRTWRKVAVLQGREQWREFFTKGKPNKLHKSRTGYELVGTSYGQMVRWQVTGQIESWLSNRANDFRILVQKSSLPPETKHQLNFINTWQAWYGKDALTMKNGTVIQPETRRFARNLFRHLLNKNRKPDFSKAQMMVDQRCVAISPSIESSEYPLWLRLSTLDKGRRLDIPLATYPYFDKRQAVGGQQALSIRIIEREGTINFGIMTDMSKAFSATKSAYRPRCEAIALDIGLKTLFATDQGDLLGRGWLEKLHRLDAKITKLAQYRQKHGLKVRSERYRNYVAQLRGFVVSEVGRILNRLVETRAPAEIVIENLDFRNPSLSQRLNRILSKFGKNAINKKLKDIEEKFGITTVLVNPAYSSQEDSSCGYVDKNNRPRQETFCCRWCGKKQHADVNAARNLLRRRSDASIGDKRRPKHVILEELVRRFNERNTRSLGRASDPRLRNPYFLGWQPKVKSIASG